MPFSGVKRYKLFQTYTVYKDGSTYYCEDQDGGLTWNANFVTLMNAVFAGASAGDEIYIMPGTFVVGSTINGKSGVSLLGSGSGTILDGSGLTDEIIEYAGSMGSVQALTGNVVKGGTSIPVTSSAAFAPGDLCFIGDNSIWEANGENQKKGEMFVVGEIPDATHVDLRHGSAPHGQGYAQLNDAYTVSATANLYKVTPMADFSVSELTLKGDGATATYGLRINYGYNVRVGNNYFKDVYAIGTVLHDCYGFMVSGNTAIRSKSGGLGYGVVLDYTCQNGVINKNTFENCKHGVAIGGGNSAIGGIPRGIIVSDNMSFEGYSFAFNCHDIGEGIVFSNNTVVNGNGGITAYMHSGAVTGNTIIGQNNEGVACLGTLYKSLLVANNIFVGESGWAINIATGAPNVTIVGNDVRASAYKILNFDNAGVNCRIFGNPGYLTENCGTATGTGAQQNVAHGLALTPNKILLSEYTTGLAIPYQSAAADATNLKITAVLNKTFAWYAAVSV
jgi:hypothetical protein